MKVIASLYLVLLLAIAAPFVAATRASDSSIRCYIRATDSKSRPLNFVQRGSDVWVEWWSAEDGEVEIVIDGDDFYTSSRPTVPPNQQRFRLGITPPPVGVYGMTMHSRTCAASWQLDIE